MSDRSGEHNTLFSVPRVTIGVGLALTALLIVLTIGYGLASDTIKGIIVFFGAGLAAVGQLALAFYASRTLRFSQEIEERRLALEVKNRATLREDRVHAYATRWTDAAMFHIRKDSQEVITQGMTNPNGVLAFIEADDVRKANVGNMLNFLEDLALSVTVDRCDEPLAKRLFCGVVVNIWHVTDEWVRQQRASRGRPQLWVETEALYNRWRS